MPVIAILMVGMWDVGRVAQMSRLVEDAAREGARVAAGGTNLGSTVTVANVQSAVQNYLTAGGMPAAAVSGAVVSVTNLSTDTWTDPGNALPLDPFSVTVTIPAGAPYQSLQLITATVCGVNSLTQTVQWMSCNDAQVTVNTQLPY